MLQATYRLDEFLLAVPFDPSHTDDLSWPQVEAHSTKSWRSLGRMHGDITQLENGLHRGWSHRFMVFAREGVDVAPDHEPCDVPGSRLVRRPAPHEAPTSHHREPVSDLEDLREPVGDQHDGAPFGGDLSKGGEQFLDLRRREDRGRLIEDEHPCFAQDHPAMRHVGVVREGANSHERRGRPEDRIDRQVARRPSRTHGGRAPSRCGPAGRA